jgi:flagellar hook-length control protein FliK
MTTLLPTPIHQLPFSPEPASRARPEPAVDRQERPSFEDALAERRSIGERENTSETLARADRDGLDAPAKTASDAEETVEPQDDATPADADQSAGTGGEPADEESPAAEGEGKGEAANAQSSTPSAAQQTGVEAQPLPVAPGEDRSASRENPRNVSPTPDSTTRAAGIATAAAQRESADLPRETAPPVDVRPGETRGTDAPTHRDAEAKARSADTPAKQVSAQPVAATAQARSAPAPTAATAAPVVEPAAVVATDTTTGADARTAGEEQGRSTPSFADRAAARNAAPAVARAVQVEAAVQLDNATGTAGGTSITPAAAATAQAPAVAPALAGVDGATAASLLTSPTDGQAHEMMTGRVVRGLTAMVNQRGGVMTMRLTPPELGQLRIQMSIVQGSVSAQFTVSNPQAEAMLERSLGVLRTALESNGLNVERLGVQMSNSDQSTSTRHDASDQGANDQSSHDAAGGESRGRQSGEEAGAEHGAADLSQFAEAFETLREPDVETAVSNGVTP